MLFFLSFLCLFTTLWPLWDTASLPAELLGQFRLQLTVLYILILPCCVWRKRVLPGFILLAVILFNLYWMHSSFAVIPTPQAEVDGKFRVLSFNIYKENKQVDDIVAAIRRADADMAFLMEVNGPALLELKSALLLQYPYYFAAADAPDYLHWVIFSKYPMKAEKQWVKGGDRQKVLFADIAYPGQNVQFFGAHTLSPRNRERIALRNAQLARLAGHIMEKADPNKPVIVAGDMNTAPWQRCLRDFQRVARLANSDSLWHITLTWPSWLPVLFAVPIDQILHNRHFCESTKYRMAPAGSDHYPVYADLYFCTSP